MLLASEKNEGYTFLIGYLLVINIYCFFDLFNDHGKWLLFLEYFWWFVQVSAIFERLFSCFFVVPISHTRKFRKKNTHTPPWFSLKNQGQSFFLNICFCNSVLGQIVDIIFVNSPHLNNFVEFYFAKTNSAKIYIFLNICSVKIYSFKLKRRS